MTEKWMKELRERLQESSAKAPEGLLAEVRQEMARRGLPPRPTAAGRAKAVPLWGYRAAAAAVVVAAGIVAWQYLAPPSSSLSPVTDRTRPAGTHQQADGHMPPPSPAAPLLAAADGAGSGRRTVSGEAAEASYRLSLPTGPADRPADAGQPDTDTPATGQQQPPTPTQPKPSEQENRQPTTSPRPAIGHDSPAAHRPQASPSPFTVATYCGGASSASSHSQGIMLAAANPIGAPEGEWSRQQAVPYLAGSGRVEHHAQHSRPVRVGLSVGYRLSERWRLHAGATYSRLSSSFSHGQEGDGYTSEQTLHYVGVPIAADYRLLQAGRLQVYATAGVTVEQLVSGKRTTPSSPANGQTAASTPVSEHRPQFSMNAGVGAEYRFGPVMGIYVEPGVSHYFNNGSTVENIYKDKPTGLSLQVGARININK